MLLPEKHILLSESIFGLSTFLLSYIIKKPLNIDEIWLKFNKSIRDKEYPKYHSFDNLILALDFLYMIGAITVDDRGKIIYEIN